LRKLGVFKKELFFLLKEYSPSVALLIVIGSWIIFVLKLVVEKSITVGFETHSNCVDEVINEMKTENLIK
jgi:hypothetical protein